MQTRPAILSACALALWAHSASAYFAQPAYEHVFQFNDVLASTPRGLAWDGAQYHVVTGGSTDGIRYARHDATGTPTATFTPGIDFRSITTDPAGNTFIRAAGSQAFQGQPAPGAFALELSVTGAFLNPNAKLLLGPDGTTLHSLMFGAVFHYDADTGVNTGFTALTGFGDLNSEADNPQNETLAIADDGTFLTYSNGVLSAWDVLGDRVGTTTLIEAGNTEASHASFSYANGLAFVIEANGGLWRGYDLIVPAPATIAVFGIALVVRRRR